MSIKKKFSFSPLADLKGKYKRSWVEESFSASDSPLLNTSQKNNLTQHYLGVTISTKRLRWFLFIIFIGLGIILARVGYLQIFRGAYYLTQAEENRIRLRPIPAERGIIYDRFKRELVENVPNFKIVIAPHDLPRAPVEREEVVDKISLMAKIPKDEIRTILEKLKTSGYETISVKENLDYQTALKLYTANTDIPGVAIESDLKRFYPLVDSGSVSSTLSLSHVLGYMSKPSEADRVSLRDKNYELTDFIGKTGLEKTYEQWLRGKLGKKKIEVNAIGKEQSVLATEPPKPGNNLILSLDLEAQNWLERRIKNYLTASHQKRAAAIALDPRNGEIIALVSWPAYSNNDFSNGISSTTYEKYAGDPDHPLFNRAIAGSYPPGSTIKLIVGSAALQENLVKTNTFFNSTGGLQVGDHFFKDWRTGGHGLTNITKAIAWSVNTYFFYIGGGYEKFVGLGTDRIARYLRLFNLADKTGIDLPGENTGFIPTREWKRQEKKENWYVGDTYNLSIGQGDLLVTPLQVAIWTAAIANGGTIITPHLLQKIDDQQTKEPIALPPFPFRPTTIRPEITSIIRDGMRTCVMEGSCQGLNGLKFAAAGKTGTAQWSTTRPTHAWFTSFAPFNNPQIVVTVLVEEGGEGSVAALPIARDFLAWWGTKYLQ